MSRLDHDTNEWQCKIVLFGAPTVGTVKLAAQLITTLPAAEREIMWDAPVGNEPTLVAQYRPSVSALTDIQPVYGIHALRTAGSTATDRQHLLGNVDGVLLLLDVASTEEAGRAERELERFLGMFGKTIASMPVVFLSSIPLDEAQRAAMNPRNQSLFAADTTAGFTRALSTLTHLLEEDSGLAGIGFDLDDFEGDDSHANDDDIEFDDLHAYDDDNP